MPELPEVETVRRRLLPYLQGRIIRVIDVRDARLVGPDDPRLIEQRLTGRRFETIDRRGKYLLFRLDGAETLISHLRMTGNWLLPTGVQPGSESDFQPPHARASMTLDDGLTVVYADARRFGTWNLLDAVETDAYIAARLGPEPLEGGFDGTVLRAAFDGRTASVKALLLDQRVVAGIGNIYADEALHRAGLHPGLPAGKLRLPALETLSAAVCSVLEEGIRQQGASIRDFRDPAGGYGSMQESFRVYGRAGEPCITCGTLIIKTRVAGRGTHVCPVCQPRPRRSGMLRTAASLKLM